MLPGRLTQAHIDELERTGEDRLYYLNRWWSLEELKELARETNTGNGGTDKEPSETARLGSAGDQVRNASVAVGGSKSRQAKPRARKEPDASTT